MKLTHPSARPRLWLVAVVALLFVSGTGIGQPTIPTIASISPGSAAVGGPAFTLTVNGAGFIVASRVQLNGSDRFTTMLSDGQLAATILASDLVTTGPRTITVITPAPGGGIWTSNSATLSVIGMNSQSAIDGFNPGANGTVVSMAVQPDGKILVGGWFTTLGGGGFGTTQRNYIGRLNADGSVDADFDPGANGPVLTMAVQPDGKILVGGYFTTLGGGGTGSTPRNYIGRLNPDGSIDASFNPGASHNILTMAVQPDGKILVGGPFTLLGGGGTGTTPRNNLGRLNTDGSLDASFNPGANGEVNVVEVQPDGKILVGGFFTTLGGGGYGTTPRNNIGRLNPDGSIDASFNPGANNRVSALAVQADGKILVGGFFTMLGGGGSGTTTRDNLGRVNADGSLDAGFNPGAGDGIFALAVQPDGKILVGGYFMTLGGGGFGTTTRKGMGRLNANGSLDTSFNPGSNSTVFTMVVQGDGKILVGGTFTTLGGGEAGPANRIFIGRLHADGSLDADLNPGANEGIFALAVEPDGKILLGGNFTMLGGGGAGTTPRNKIGRLNPDGSLDSSFNPGTDTGILTMVVQPDGKILVGGPFTMLGGGGTGTTPRNKIGRLNPDGSLDASFNPGANGTVSVLALQTDGKILVGGFFTTLGGGGTGATPRNNIGRLNPDGSLDASFNPGANGSVSALAVQADGKILVGGSFTALGGGTGTTPRNYIGRLNADGSLDASFNPGANSDVFAFAVEPDGKILLGGNFTALGGGAGTTPRSNIGRLNADGSLDASFNPGANGTIVTIAVQADGRILVGGPFTRLGGGGNGPTRNFIGRLNADGSLDTSFDPGANSTVLGLALQADGKILAGGFFTTLGGGGTGTTPRNYVGRLTNTDAAIQSLAVTDSGHVTWWRSGASPAVGRVTFESSPDGVTYTLLGSGTSVAGGWQLTGQNLPASQNLYIRAQGFYATGEWNGSGSITESIRNVYLGALPPTVASPASATPNPVTATTTSLSVLGADDGGEANLVYTWATTGTPPAPVSYSANGTNAAKNVVATFTKAGNYSFQVTLKDAGNLTATSAVNVTVNQTLTSISVAPASATVPGGGTQLYTATAADQFNVALATQPSFTWVVSGGGTINAAGLFTAGSTPGGPFTVTATGGSGTGNTTVTVTGGITLIDFGSISSANTYGLAGWSTPIKDVYTDNRNFGPGGTTIVTGNNYSYNYQGVQGTPRSFVANEKIIVTWYNNSSTTVLFTPKISFTDPDRINAGAVGTWYDMTPVSVSAFGSATSEYIFNSSSAGAYSLVNVNANYSNNQVVVADKIQLSGSGSGNQPPTVATPASATPNLVTGTTTSLSVLGANNGGEANLVYTWATTGTPPAPVSFSANGTNAAKSVVATFTKAGSYSFLVTIRDQGNLTVTSAVNVTVNQTLTSISVAPASATVAAGGTQQFTATALDQFNAAGPATAAIASFTPTLVTGVSDFLTGGWAFTVNQAALVTALGYYRLPGPIPDVGPHTIGIFSPSGPFGSLLVSATVPSVGAGGTLINNFQYVTLSAPYRLDPGNYLIGASPRLAPAVVSSTDLVSSPLITFMGGRESCYIECDPNLFYPGNLGFPNLPTGANGDFGPNMLIAEAPSATPLLPQPSFTWSVSGGGTISASGLFTAGSTAGGPFNVSATSGAITGGANVTVVNAPPTVATPASAIPNPVTATTTNLSVLGADDGGEANLIYTWATTGAPPAPVSFSANGTNAAKNVVATFTKAGSYSFLVTIKDPGNLTVTSAVNVTVNATVTAINVAPASATVPAGTTQQFTATALDQFSVVLATQPSFAWSVTGGGTINASGLFTAGSTAGGPFAVNATSGVVVGSATVNVSQVQLLIDGFDPGADAQVLALAWQPDGKILVGGTFTTLGGGGTGTTTRKSIGRLNADGSLDTSFNPGANGGIWTIIVQPDGKILIGGSFTTLGGGGTGTTPRNNIGRLNADGSVDTSFNPGANGFIDTIAVQADGKVLVGGNFTTMGGGGTGTTARNNIGRLNTDGSVDISFNPGANGRVTTIVVQADGKILAGGFFTTLGGGGTGTAARNNIGRLNADGSLDASFNPGADGWVTTIAVQTDGRILVGGAFHALGGGTGTTPLFNLGRLNADGSVDTGFNPGASPFYLTDTIVVQPDGKILVGGASDGSVFRLNPDGSLDTGFAQSVPGIEVNAIAVQPDGKIVVGGYFRSLLRNYIARVNPDGSYDTTFDPGANGIVHELTAQPDGKILVGGLFSTLGGGGTGATARNYIARLNPDSSVDAGFNPGANCSVNAFAVQPDGKILVGGCFTTFGGGGTGTIARSSIARLNADGSLDLSFNPGANSGVAAMALQADGKIVVAGAFTMLGGGGSGTTPRNYIGRLNADGSLDTSFNPGANGSVYRLALQVDGKILVSGIFSTLGGGGTGNTPRHRIGRLNADGSVDLSFNPGANSYPSVMTVQADGKILVGGDFTMLGGGGTGTTVRNYIGRLNADGSLDTSFNPGANLPVWTMALQVDGKIVVGGSFTALGGGSGTTARNYIGRLNANGSLDTAFNPGANDAIEVLAAQADGTILAGGYFTALGGLARNKIGRVSDTTAALQSLSIGSDVITWSRAGAGPEVQRVAFEMSIDRVAYTALGTGTRVAGGWQLTGQTMPPNQNLYIRARGFYEGSILESIRNIYFSAPNIATAASATPNPVAGTTTNLSVLGADDGGEANLVYTWATTGTPPAPVSFSANGSNAAKNVIATFTKAGNYSFQVTIKDPGNLTVISAVNVTVNQTLTSIIVAPAIATVPGGGTQQFTATALDQFIVALTTQPSFTWAVSGGGTISPVGLFTAGSTAGGPFNVSATSGAISGGASVTVVVVNAPPTVASPASATPNPVTATTTNLSVLGADDGGEANLVYTWATTGTPPAPVSYSANGTNAAKNVVATFTKAGNYSFQVTIKDQGNLTVTSAVNVTVNQTLTSIIVAPPSTTIPPGATQQFTATALDQFTVALAPQPSFTWTVTGGGTINTAGLFTAGSTAGGPFAVRATSGSGFGLATVTVTGGITLIDFGSISSANTYGLAGWSTPIKDVYTDNRNFGPGGTTIVTGNNYSYNYQGVQGTPRSFVANEKIIVTWYNNSSTTVLFTPKISFTDPDRINAGAVGTWYDMTPVSVSGFGSATSEYIFISSSAGSYSLVNVNANYSNNQVVVADKIQLSGSGSGNQPPTVATPASATPSPVTGTTTSLSVLGANNGGEANLVYTWATTGTPPAPVSFGANGTNAAKNAVATFTKAGSYSFLVTIKDQGNLTVTSAVNVTVNQTLTSIGVAPASATVAAGGTQQFAATALDQFNAAGPATAAIASFTPTLVAGVSDFLTGGWAFTVNQAALVTALGYYRLPGPIPDAGPHTIGIFSPSGPFGSLLVSATVPSVGAGGTLINNFQFVTLSTPYRLDPGDYLIGASPRLAPAVLDSTDLVTSPLITFMGGRESCYMGCDPNSFYPGNLGFPNLTTGAKGDFGPNMLIAEAPSATPLLPQPSFTWSVNGGGTISASGLFTAGSTAGGPFTVTATSGGINGTASVTVSVPTSPVISNLNPSSAIAGGPQFTLTVNGSQFVNGAQVLFGGVQRTTTFVNSSQLTAIIPATEFVFSGTPTVQVRNPDLQGSNPMDFHVLPSVTNLSPSSIIAGGPAFSLVLTGTGFSAAAVVKFGATALAPSFAFPDQLSVTVAANLISQSGIVNITVIGNNGETSSPFPLNIIANAPPTVGTAAAATPNPVTGTTANLSALGADDSSEANLVYTWATTGTPPAPVSFGANGTNAAKNAVATFTKAGSYSFLVTIKDQGNLTVTSAVNVTVNQTLTSIGVAPASATVAAGGTQQFAATALDQFNAAGPATAAIASFTPTLVAGVSDFLTGGWAFTVNQAALVTALGYYRLPGPVPDVGPHTIGIFSPSGPFGSLLVSATVPSVGAGGTLINDFQFVTLSTPYRLDPGDYLIGASPRLAPAVLDSTDLVTSPLITFRGGRESCYMGCDPNSFYPGNLGFPNLTTGAKGDFGPNMLIAEAPSATPLLPQPSFTWSVNGGGTISASGLFTAGSTAGGPFTVTATSGAINGTASVTVSVPTSPVISNLNPSSAIAGGPQFTLTVNGSQFVNGAQVLFGGVQRTTTFVNSSQLTAIIPATEFVFSGTPTVQVRNPDLQGSNPMDFHVLPSVTNSSPSSIIAGGPAFSLVLTGTGFSAAAVVKFGATALAPSFAFPDQLSVTVAANLISQSGIVNITVIGNNGETSSPFPLNIIANAPPTVGTAAAATPNPVTGTTANLSALGADDSSEANLVYTWATTGTPPAPVSFGANGTNAAKNAVATFTKAGSYSFLVTIKDQGNLTVTSAVNMTVNQTLTLINVIPASATVPAGTTQQFTATALDQFNLALATQPPFTWTVTGGGTINAAGLFTAGSTAGGPFAVNAASGGVIGSATVNVTSGATVTYVQGAGTTINTGATTIAQAFTTANTSGNLIVAAVSWGTSASLTCSDSQGNTYSVATTQYDGANNQSLAICYAANVKTGANTVTATFSSASGYRRLLIHEYQGIASVNPVNVVTKNVANGTTASNAITSTSALTTVNGDLVFGAVVDDTGVTTITAGTGFTQRRLLPDMATEDLVQAASGSIAATQTFAAAHRYLAQMVAFKHN